MKLKSLALNAIAMEHSEMKEVKAGWGNDACRLFNNINPGSCMTDSGSSCMTDDGNWGTCKTHEHGGCYCS